MYITRKSCQFGTLLGYSALLWIALSTFVPKISFFDSGLPSQLTNQSIQLLIAHPDDEVMFFTPTITELLKPSYNNDVSVTCYSTGNDQGIGAVREQELVRSLDILGIKNYEIISDEAKFKDSMELEWEPAEIAKYVHENTTVILTFDKGGVSNHPNHISLYHGAMLTDKPVIFLKTWPIYLKYSFTVATNFELVYKYLLQVMDTIKISPVSSSKVVIYTDFPSTMLGFAAMSNAHQSQMVWFRYLWFLVSRYTHTNELQLHRF